MNSPRPKIFWRAAVVLKLFLGAAAAGAAVPGETADPPQAPYLQKLPASARYVMVESAAGKDKRATDAKARLHLTRISVAKTGDTRQIVGEYSNGKTLEAWMYKGLVLIQQWDPPDVVINTLETTQTNLPIGNDDFGGLNWLSVETYQKIVTLEGRKCYLFEKPSGDASSNDVPRVWVNVATRLPEAMERQGTTYHLEYGPPPADPLPLSPAFAKAWQAYQGSLPTVTSTAPRPPYVGRLPDFSRYEMTEIPTGKADAAKDPTAGLRLARAVVSKTGTTKQIVGVLGSGKTIEAWLYKGIVMQQQFAPPDIILNTVEDTLTRLPVSTTDFRDFDWLNAQNYKSEITYEGSKCFLFELTSGEASAKEPWRAVIDEKTKLPVMLERQGAAYRFQYDPAPAQELQLSPEFAAAWQKYQISLRSMRARSAPH